MKDLAEMSVAIRNIGGLKFSAQTRKHEVIFDQPKEELSLIHISEPTRPY